MTRINVDANLFYAASLFTEKNHKNYRLEGLLGVLIEKHENGGVNIIATNGICMFIAHDATGRLDGEATIVSLKKDILKKCKATISEKEQKFFEVDGHYPTKRRLELNDDMAKISIEGKLIDSQNNAILKASFPLWKQTVTSQLIPTDEKISYNDIHINLNPEFLSLFNEAAKVLTSGRDPIFLSFQPNASDEVASPVSVRFNKISNVFGLIMPCRTPFERGASLVPHFLNI